MTEIIKIEALNTTANSLVNEWEVFVRENPYGSIFQAPQMVQFVQQTSIAKPFTFIAMSEGQITGVVSGFIMKENRGLTGLLSTRAIVYGGPVVAHKNGEQTMELLLKKLTATLKRKVIFIEFRNLNNYTRFSRIFQEQGFLFRPHLNFIVDCTDLPAALQRLSKSKRRQINIAERNSTIVEEASTIDDIKAFYAILADLYRNKVKQPIPGIGFFLSFAKSDVGKILVVKVQNMVVGGIVCPVLPGKIIYEWYICGLDKTYKRNYPSVMATWGAIQYAAEHNIPAFDFMGAGHPAKIYGVREFKSKFGGQLVEYGRFFKATKPFICYIAKTALKVYQKVL